MFLICYTSDKKEILNQTDTQKIDPKKAPI